MESRVRIRREPMDYKSLAWLSEFKQQNTTVYPEDPFVFTMRVQPNIYGFLHESCDGAWDVWSYLVLGTEKALAIDTGYGIGDYAKLIRKLAGDREIIAVNTHYHPDHIGGNFQFGKVYCHPYCNPYMKGTEDVRRLDEITDADGNGIFLEFDRKDVPEFRPYEIESITNGDILDLGGDCLVEVVWLPGHSCGGIGLLDRRDRILFAGDAIMSGRLALPGPHDNNPYGKYETVTALHNAMLWLEMKRADFDWILSGHNRVPIGADAVEKLLKASAEILRHPEEYDVETRNFVPGQKVLLKKVAGLGDLEYKLSGL